MKKITVNLKGPVVVNPKNYTGKQVISEVEQYTVRHELFHPEDSKQEAAGSKGGDE
jgi:flagellar assembly factor FliW